MAFMKYYAPSLVLALFVLATVTNAATLIPATVRCTPNLQSNLSEGFRGNSIIITGLESNEIRQLCTETIPETVLQLMVSKNAGCTFAAPGMQVAGSESLESGWSMICYKSASAEVSPLILAAVALLYPLLFVGTILSFPWSILVALAIYGAITYYGKLKLINPFLIPLFFGLLGGIAAALAWKKMRIRLLAFGIAAYFVVLVILFGVMASTRFLL